MFISAYHSHLGEVEQAILSEVGGALVYVGEVGQVDAEVWDAGRVAPAVKFQY